MYRHEDMGIRFFVNVSFISFNKLEMGNSIPVPPQIKLGVEVIE
jgi:hypothetical protein